MNITDIKLPIMNLSKKDNFLKNLRFMYHLMVASEDLLKEAIPISKGWLNDYYVSHIEEERGHAKWLYDDLKGDVGDYDLTAAACAGTQYYLIKHVHPIALLGYMSVLECHPMNLEIVSELEKLHGKELCRCLRFHAENDVFHGADLEKILGKVPAELENLVISNAIQTASLIKYGLEG